MNSMIFRERISETTPETVQGVVNVEPKETEGIVKDKDDVAVGENSEQTEQSELDKWETQYGKYGAEYLGIQEIVKEFPYSANFAKLDKYIRDEISERGEETTRESWQTIMNEIEREIGSSKLGTFERLRRLTDYVSVMRKYKEAKKKRDMFRFM